MQLIITDAWLAKSRALHLTGTQLIAAFMLSAVVLMLLSLGLYHWVFLKGAREGWPIIGSLVKLVAKDDFEQRDRFLRENLDVMARKLGEMQVKLTQLESLGERVSGLAGVGFSVKVSAGAGGPLIDAHALSLQEILATMNGMEQQTDLRMDAFTSMESELFALKIKRMMLPTQKPVAQSEVGSGFGWRVDPITGRSALHEGLDFPAPIGSAIYAAAGGVVVVQDVHPDYGNMVEIEHGNDLITRYAHSSRVFVKKGDLVKRGQKIAEIGTTGRSTGPHLHFEVLVQGVAQDPEKFLAAGQRQGAAPMVAMARRSAVVLNGLAPNAAK